MEPAVNPYQSPDAPLVAELVTPNQLPLRSLLPPGAIGFAGALTVAESLEAHRLFVPWYSWRSWGGIAMLLALAMCLFFVSTPWFDRQATGDSLYLAFALVVIMAVYMAVVRLLLPRQARRFYAQRFGAYVETTGYVAPEELVSSTTFASTFIRWPAFRGYRNSANIILLYCDNAPDFVILARSKFVSDEDWQAALAIVASRLGQV
jgi:hypothetical protein